MPEVVIDPAATVRPWKPPWKTMTFGLPVAWRLSRSAASIASLPEFAKNMLSSPRREDLAQSLDQREQRTVHDGGVLRVDQRADLSLRRFDHAGVAVAGAGHADPCGEVEVSAVVFVVEQNALTAGREHAGRLLEDLRELRGPGHGVPLVCRR